MGWKTGFSLGVGAGYVLGARAGRARYEEIRRMWQEMLGSPKVQRAKERTKEVAGDKAKRGLEAVQESVSKAGSAVKGRLGKDEPSLAVEDRLDRDYATIGTTSDVAVTPTVDVSPGTTISSDPLADAGTDLGDTVIVDTTDSGLVDTGTTYTDAADPTLTAIPDPELRRESDQTYTQDQ